MIGGEERRERGKREEEEKKTQGVTGQRIQQHTRPTHIMLSRTCRDNLLGHILRGRQNSSRTSGDALRADRRASDVPDCPNHAQHVLHLCAI